MANPGQTVGRVDRVEHVGPGPFQQRGADWYDRVASPAAERARKPETDDKFDVQVHDAAALDEIEMMTNLMIATSDAEGPLPQDEVDEILGVDQ